MVLIRKLKVEQQEPH